MSQKLDSLSKIIIATGQIIQTGIKWRLPDTVQDIITRYILPIPKGITPSFYLWISTGRRRPYKVNCLINRLAKKKEFLFNQSNT